jgi:hypothetical protein
MRPLNRPICDICEYYVSGINENNDRGKPVCRPFPEGIPPEIINGGFDHRKPLGDETIMFKPREDVTDQDIRDWEQEYLEAREELRTPIPSGQPDIFAQHMRGLGDWLGRLPSDWPVTIDLSAAPDWWVRFPTPTDGWVEEAYLPVSATDVPDMSVVVVEKQKLLQMLQLGSWRALGPGRMSAHYSDRNPTSGRPGSLVLQETFPPSHLGEAVDLLSGSLELPREVLAYYGAYLGVMTLWGPADRDSGETQFWVSGDIPEFLDSYLQVSVGGICELSRRTTYSTVALRDPPMFGDGRPVIETPDVREILELANSLSNGNLPLEVVMRALDDPQHRWAAVGDDRLSSEIVGHLARSPSHDTRQQVACRAGLPEEILDALSLDPDYRVREAVARRTGLTASIAARLAEDPVAEVRNTV